MSELIPRISSKIHDFLNLLFAVDAECILCGEEAHTDNFGMCKNCASMLIYPNDTEDLLNKNQYLDGICVAFAYSGTVPDGVLRMKYGHRLYLSEKFAALMDVREDWEIDVAVAVPMYKKKLNARLYNHSDLMARFLCSRLRIPYDGSLLMRIKPTPAQMRATRKDRLVLQAGSVLASDDCDGKSILLIDDVCTTGSTVNECAKVMKEKGAKAVYVTVFAHGKA
ncbi:MAG: ComF family protein [Clostridia bacterium]|nr:ComF family protein [Clostridia bacterium]